MNTDNYIMLMYGITLMVCRCVQVYLVIVLYIIKSFVQSGSNKNPKYLSFPAVDHELLDKYDTQKMKQH